MQIIFTVVALLQHPVKQMPLKLMMWMRCIRLAPMLGLLLAASQLPTCVLAQPQVAAIMRKPPLRLPFYPMPTAGSRHTLLTMKFASNQWLDTSGLALLEGATVLAVDLVFTDYPAHLDLVSLNTSRFKALFARLPMLANDPNIAFDVVRQMDGNTKEAAAGMMHGFVVHYRPAPQPTDVDDERYIVKMAVPPRPRPKPPDGAKPKVRHWDYKYRSTADATGMSDTGTHYEPPGMRDSAFYNSTKRQQWQQMVVVADVTGSMAPYNRDLLLWLQQHEKDNRLKAVVFFNDGDQKADRDKQLGRTGGIYAGRYNNIFDATGLMQQAKRHLGGDFAENDLEALLAGEALCDDSSQLVLLADSWAPVRDLELVTRLKRPVRVVALGGNLGLHPDYVTIALVTGGSLHFLNQDISDFTELKAGKPMTIRQKTYVWDGVRVVRK
ncbi:MAG: hypothetical protein EAY75_15550 [Bacteroidetes bacterium]|nr:MAG: hypothetical protein EAY75_15550 [Bacteroidota bacterium]